MKTKHKFNVTMFKQQKSKFNTMRFISFVLLMLFITTLNTAFSQDLRQQIIRLHVTNQFAIDETILVFMDNATEGFDNYDSHKISNNNLLIPEIFTTINGEQIVINSMPYLTADKDIQIGFKTGTAGTFSIFINEFTNFPAGTLVTLINNINKESKIISDGLSYSFYTGAITKNDMFTLKIDLPNIISDPEPDPNPNPDLDPDPNPVPKITFSVNQNNRIVITCNEEIAKGAKFIISSLTGKVEINRKLTETITEVQRKLPAGTYVITVNNGGVITSGKVTVGNN